jgi:hypothetical protein
MAKTINAYVPDRGEIVVNVTSGEAAAMSEITTAGAKNLDTAVRKLEETAPKTREHTEVYVTGSNDPILTMSAKGSATTWTLTLVDDYSSGAQGEIADGAGWLAAVEIFQAYFDNAQTMSDVAITPAGSVSPMIETTLTNCEVKSITHPMIDADATAPNEVTIILLVESFVKAAHA